MLVSHRPPANGTDQHPLLTVDNYEDSKISSIAATAFSCMFGRTWL
jgi:hypothetical protein